MTIAIFIALLVIAYLLWKIAQNQVVITKNQNLAEENVLYVFNHPSEGDQAIIRAIADLQESVEKTNSLIKAQASLHEEYDNLLPRRITEVFGQYVDKGDFPGGTQH